MRGLPRRLAPTAAVAGLLALAGAANATMRDHPPPGPAASRQPDPAVVVSPATSSSAWYCAGPLPLGDSGARASVQVTDLRDVPVRGEVVVASPAGTVARAQLEVAARSTSTYTLPAGGPRRQAAATVLVDGSGVAVEEVVEGTVDGTGRAPMAAPCADRAGPTAYLPAGASDGADEVSLAIYDPGATPAVADVSLATPAGPVAPPGFQGVPVPAGTLVVLDVGRSDPGQAAIATAVRASGGEVVAGALLTSAAGHGVERSLLSAAEAPAASWTFAPAPAGQGASQTVAVYDPGPGPATLVLRSGGTGGPAEASATVPAGGVIGLAPASEPAAGALRFEELVVARGSPVVAERELASGRLPAAGPPAGAGPRLATTLPPGYAVSGGASGLSSEWVLPVDASPGRSGELVEVADLGRLPARVELERLGTAGGDGTTLVRSLTLAAGAAASVAVGELALGAGPGSLLLVADRDVVACAVLYAGVPAGATGMATPLGVPVTAGAGS